MAQNDQDVVDITSVNKTKKTLKLLNPVDFFKKKSAGPGRDQFGQFTGGSGGLLSGKKFKWSRAIPLVIAVALVGGFLVFRSFAATSKQYIYIQADVMGQTSVASRKMYKIASDGSIRSTFPVDYTYSIGTNLSRKKDKFVASSTNSSINAGFITTDSSTGAKLGFVPNSTTKSYYGDFEWLTGDKAVAYQSDSSPATLNRINIDGTGKKVIAAAKAGYTPLCATVQPTTNATKIAYHQSSGSAKPDFINVMNLDGTGAKTIATVSNGQYLSCPIWSPDGTKIAYTHYLNTNLSTNQFVTVVNADGSGAKVVGAGITGSTKGFEYNNAPNSPEAPLNVWSPGKTSILVKKYANGVQNLVYINIATKKETKVTANTSKATLIKEYGWLTDGKIMYSHGDLYGTKTVVTVNSDGTNKKSIFSLPAKESVTDVDF